MGAKSLKDFLFKEELYHQGSGGALARAPSWTKAKEGLYQIQGLSRRENDINLCWRLQLQGCYWHEMAKDVAEI